MTVLAPYVAEVLLLRYMLSNGQNLHLYLYKNYSTAPAYGDTLSTYSSNEPVDTAYTASTLASGGWAVTTYPTTSITTAAYSTLQTFSLSLATSVQGYYVTDTANANLLWAEKFDTGSITIPAGGGVVTISPSVQLQ
jgi:hypothetical protein